MSSLVDDSGAEHAVISAAAQVSRVRRLEPTPRQLAAMQRPAPAAPAALPAPAAAATPRPTSFVHRVEARSAVMRFVRDHAPQLFHVALLAVALVWALAHLHGCAPAARSATHVAVVTAGAGVAAVHAAHEAAYRDATDALRARLRDAGATLADYDREAAPVNAAFRARGAAIQSLDADLYAAAAVLDATRGGAPVDAYRRMGARLVEALDRTLRALRDGAAGLPPVRIPREVIDVVDDLRALTGRGDSDV